MDDAATIRAIAADVLAPQRDNKSAEPALDRNAAALAIYRNNMRVGIARALGEKFPVTRALVGDDFFKVMARSFIEAAPPRTPMIADYGDNFPNFIDEFAPARTIAYLADMARFEILWLRAYRAADKTPLSTDEIVCEGGEDPSTLKFQFHPSAQLFSSRYPVASIWRRHQPDADKMNIDPAAGEDALIVRPERDVSVIILESGAHTALERLKNGKTVADAFAAAAASSPDFDAAAAFSLIMQSGAVITASQNFKAPYDSNL